MFKNKYKIRVEPTNKELEAFLEISYFYKSISEDYLEIAKKKKIHDEYYVLITNIHNKNIWTFKL